MFGYSEYMHTTVTTINQPIYVVVDFSFPIISIRSFTWGGREYEVDGTNMFHIERNQQKSFYHFAVSSGGNSYELVYDPVMLDWRLEAIVN